MEQKSDVKKRHPKPTANYREEFTSDFYLRMALHIYGEHSGGFGHWAGQQHKFATLREYARGTQDPSIYRKALVTRTDKGYDKRKDDDSNLLDRNTRVFPSIRAKAISKIIGSAYGVEAKAVDEGAHSKRRQNYMTDLLASHPAMQYVIDQSGVGMEGMTAELYGASREDIQAYEALGGYKLGVEIVLGDAINATREKSMWDTLSRRWAEDVFDLGVCAARIERPYKANFFLVKYVDPESLVISRSLTGDFTDAWYAGELRTMTIPQLRERGISESKIEEICLAYRGRFGNPEQFTISQEDRSRNNQIGSQVNNELDTWSVQVLDCYFLASETEKYITGCHHRDGNFVFSKTYAGKPIRESLANKGYKEETHIVQYVHKVLWVVGTNELLEAGVDETIVRYGNKGNKKALLPIVAYCSNEPSMVERCIEPIDSVELSARSIRRFLKKLPPGPQIAIDISLMEESLRFADGTSISVQDSINMYAQEGVFLYSSSSEFQTNPLLGNRKPIEPMTSDMSSFNLYQAKIAAAVADMKEMIGLNAMTDASLNPTNVLTGVMQSMESSTSAALGDLMAIIAGNTLNALRVVGLKYQSLVANGNISIYSLPSATSNARIISLYPNLLEHDFDFTLIKLPSRDELSILLNYVSQLTASNQLGADGALFVTNHIMKGELRKAQFFLSYYINKAKAEAAAAQQRAIQAQGEQNIAAAAVQKQLEGQNKAAEMEVKKEIAALQAARVR